MDMSSKNDFPMVDFAAGKGPVIYAEIKVSQQLIQALQNKALFDHPVEQFELVETHISWVILTGPYAYKIKKPSNFGFLDFSTLEKRHHFCREELRLNRRLAPDLYVDIVPITGNASAPILGGNDEPFEYAVRMVQFDQRQLLDRVLARGELETRHINEIADLVADFHQQVDTATDDTRYSEPKQVIEPIQYNFEHIRPLLEDPTDLQQLGHLEAWARDTHALLETSLVERKRQGFIRECHGDLHLGNIALIDGKVTLFDCIEFNDEYRWIDVFSEVAGFIMDLEARGQQGFANTFLNAYLERTGDYAGLKLLDFYKAYRAMVRAKVTLLGLHDAAPDKTAQIFSDYRRYADLAQHYMQIPNRYLMLMHGYSGTGKSTVSSALIETLGVIRLRSDVVRKQLFDAAAQAQGIDAGIYSHAASDATFHHLAELAGTILAAGKPVVVDATFLRAAYRKLFDEVSGQMGVPLQIISCELADELARDRIEARALQAKDPSDADIAVYTAQQREAGPLSEEELAHTLKVDTSSKQNIDAFIEQLAQCFIA